MTAVVLAATAAAGGCGGSQKSNAATGAGSSSNRPTTAGPASTGPASSAPAANSGSGDFCSKISDAEVTAVLGVPIGRREQPSAAPTGVEGCIKGTPRQALNNLAKAAYVSFSMFPAQADFGSIDQVKSKFADGKVLTGLGDQALFVPSAGVIYGFLQGKVFSVQVVKAGKPGTESDAVTMAKALLSRIG